MIKYSRNTISIADKIVRNHAIYDRFDRSYSLDYYSIPDFELEELSASLMLDDESYANEALGPDNPDFSKNMLPALIGLLQNSVDSENKFQFITKWRHGVVKYFDSSMQSLLEERVAEYHFNMKYERGAA